MFPLRNAYDGGARRTRLGENLAASINKQFRLKLSFLLLDILCSLLEPIREVLEFDELDVIY